MWSRCMFVHCILLCNLITLVQVYVCIKCILYCNLITLGLVSECYTSRPPCNVEEFCISKSRHRASSPQHLDGSWNIGV